MKPESVLGIGGKTGLEGHGGLERMVEGGLVLMTGGEEPISGGVSTGLKFRSGEGWADSMEVLTWSSRFCRG